MNYSPVLRFLLVLLAACMGAALAETADRDKPMHIEADALRYDDIKRVSVFTGRVVLTKGSILIRGDVVEVRRDAQGYQYGWVTGSGSAPAFFRQKREGVDETIEGEGEAIEYDGRADVVKFSKGAQLRRLRGASLADEIVGALIVYDNLNGRFSVDGSQGGLSSVGKSGRVRAMLTPKPDDTLAAPASPDGPVTPGLRAAPALGGVPN
ncbi:MAG: lipopolysaccharide transport periplasmic protein LptA [Rhodoferax sp.]|nr:lipopolysaccharide transport periplasmic protein LptA [Rhodoferax sp.]MCF8210999.1 lipopolysaccharide transport periplasmic protein LptA [Rhodoferax sp.]